MTKTANHAAQRAFTLIELLVVMAALALLLGVAAPQFMQHIDRAREAALRSNLAAMRDAIDRFHADRGAYPGKLDDLVEGRYLRAVPLDPFLERADSWTVVAPPPGTPGRVADVRSGASGQGRDGRAYASW